MDKVLFPALSSLNVRNDHTPTWLVGGGNGKADRVVRNRWEKAKYIPSPGSDLPRADEAGLTAFCPPHKGPNGIIPDVCPIFNHKWHEIWA